MSAAAGFAASDDGEWAQLFADNLAAALRRRGYDAHPHGTGAGVTGVQIRAVHVAGWRYPDGHWEFRDQPAQIIADLDGTTEPSWSLVDHHREVVIPAFGSVDAIADWIICELPEPDHLTCRLERHPDFIDTDSTVIPDDWYQAWQKQEANHDGM
jgi:hypothetical protein